MFYINDFNSQVSKFCKSEQCMIIRKVTFFLFHLVTCDETLTQKLSNLVTSDETRLKIFSIKIISSTPLLSKLAHEDTSSITRFVCAQTVDKS